MELGIFSAILGLIALLSFIVGVVPLQPVIVFTACFFMKPCFSWVEEKLT